MQGPPVPAQICSTSLAFTRFGSAFAKKWLMRLSAPMVATKSSTTATIAGWPAEPLIKRRLGRRGGARHRAEKRCDDPEARFAAARTAVLSRLMIVPLGLAIRLPVGPARSADERQYGAARSRVARSGCMIVKVLRPAEPSGTSPPLFLPPASR